ncbi:MAG: aminotransferase class I/II-fold pyridoxal phosphate-dependent enzyme [Beijerinckiaceae bacterium]
MAKINNLADIASKQLAVAERVFLENGNPFHIPTDRLREEAEAKGGHFVSFAHYDYLGLANHPAINAAAVEALETLGIGVLASRLVGGERSIHRQFEKDLAGFLGVGSVLTLVSGYLTNVTVIPHVTGARDAIFLDELSHNSIVNGARSSTAENVVFRHNDLDHLEFLLRQKRDSYRNVLIVVESLYSMDGDVVDLARLVEMKERHNFWLLVDEAHSIGVLGQDGRGLCEFAGVDPNQVDLIIGTLSKTFASCGGFVAGKEVIVDWLRLGLAGFVYSVGLSPVITAAAHKALQLVQKESWRVEKLRQNAELFVELARQAGLDTGPAIGRGVVPIIFSDPKETFAVSRHLMNNGYYVPPIAWIGVPKDQPRLRFFISAAHSEADIRGVIGLLARPQQRHAVSARSSLSVAT